LLSQICNKKVGNCKNFSCNFHVYEVFNYNYNCNYKICNYTHYIYKLGNYKACIYKVGHNSVFNKEVCKHTLCNCLFYSLNNQNHKVCNSEVWKHKVCNFFYIYQIIKITKFVIQKFESIRFVITNLFRNWKFCNFEVCNYIAAVFKFRFKLSNFVFMKFGNTKFINMKFTFVVSILMKQKFGNYKV